MAGTPNILRKTPLWGQALLQDDYIKFFRLSQVQIEQARCGILGLITNHAFTDNPTLRGMRD
jgi:predicted helicase